MKKTHKGLSVAQLRRATELQKHIEARQGEIERSQIALDRLLGKAGKAAGTVTMANIRGAGVKRTKRDENFTATGRPRNAMTMHDAIAKVTARSPKTLDQIVEGITKLGYKFAAQRPANSVGAFLYGKLGKKAFRNVDARFSPK